MSVSSGIWTARKLSRNSFRRVNTTKKILLRLGKIRQKQEYAVGKVKKSLYETPFGDIEVSMKTYEIKVDMVDGIGRIYLAYDVLLGELTSTYNQLFMEIREDRA